MNFYQAQDQARGRTRLLVLLFLLVNLALILLINFLFASYMWANDDSLVAADKVLFEYLSWQRLLGVSVAVTLLLLFASWLKWLDVSQGGGAIAEALGGERIVHATPDALQRRLLNVVEEMALAAGVPVPPVYLMRRESGINAFAAGLGLSDAAICVTKGALEGLDRDQLQGVIAHEFSHILNGDMRLNMRLIVTLHGMIFFGELGREFVGSRTSWWVDATKSRSSSRGYLVLFGLGLMLVGWLGVLLGNLIKSAISRQREFLADASAVQFTRNPDGVSGALKVIGGSEFQSTINHPGCHEVSHLFFGAVAPRQLFSSHPPLAIRIRRIEPGWDGRYMDPLPPPAPPVANLEKSKPRKDVVERMLGSLVATEVFSADSNDWDVVSQGHEQIPDALIDLAHDPYGARALLLGLLLEAHTGVRKQQLALIATADHSLAEQVSRFQLQIDAVPRELYLCLIEMAIPALKAQSKVQYSQFKRILIQVVQADKEIDLFEWTLYQLVSRYCDAHFGRARSVKVKYSTLEELAEAFTIVLSTLALHGSTHGSTHSSTTDDARQQAFTYAAGSVGLYNIKMLPVEACERKAFSAAVSELACATPFLKQRLLRGLVKCVRKDAVIVPFERELITAVAAVMESPLLDLELDS